MAGSAPGYDYRHRIICPVQAVFWRRSPATRGSRQQSTIESDLAFYYCGDRGREIETPATSPRFTDRRPLSCANEVQEGRRTHIMKFGVFYELQLPRPWQERSEYDLFNNALTQIELADKLGYDYAWAVEHHFLEEYSHCSAPEVFLGAASQRTKQIRLGHGVIQMTTNDPHRVAEKVATLDLLSGGRVELGMGEAGGPSELHPFNVRVRDKRERWIESVKATMPMFTQNAWEFHGDYYDFPARNVLPKPLQKPHPPLWVACSSIQTIGAAASWGMGALGFSFVSPESAQAWVHRYYNTFLNDSNPLTDYPKNANIAVVSGFMCADTDEEALAKASGWTFFQFALQYYGRHGVDKPGESDVWGAYQEWRHTEKAEKALRNGLVGSPETIRKRLTMLAEANVDQVILLNQAGNTSHEDICTSLEMFASEIMPEFHAMEDDHAQWKRDVLERRIVLEELSTDGYDLYAHQNRDMLRPTTEQLKVMMAAKETAAAAAAADEEYERTREEARSGATQA
ncbi:LLM class flavin-dependent oxidoreductase [Rhodococcus sp. NM-2]|uniref:LLM class flavin-dependent oxidoreductase n=1 Tax=Rhodococcus sp. NM-2 TaxID=3401174 RepID=UPI003AABEE41